MTLLFRRTDGTSRVDALMMCVVAVLYMPIYADHMNVGVSVGFIYSVIMQSYYIKVSEVR